jgi:hypothetical protein
LDGSKAIGIIFTDKPVTAWGGRALFVAFSERVGLAEKLAEALPFTVTLPNATPPAQILLAFFPEVLAGACRFAQLALLRVNEPVHQLFGLRRYQSSATFTRSFRRFTAKSVTQTFEPLFADLAEARCIAHVWLCKRGSPIVVQVTPTGGYWEAWPISSPSATRLERGRVPALAAFGLVQ